MKLLSIPTLIILLLTATSARAVDLLTVYQQALQTDPVVLQAKANRDAALEVVPQRRAGLLPNVAATANLSRVRNSSSDPNYSNDGNQHSYQLTLAQPVFNLANWLALTAAHAQARQAEATYQSALQTLILRTAGAYFNVLQAQDMLQYTQAQKKATAKQLLQIKQQYQVGISTMTDVYQAQAANDQLVAQLITAQNNVANNFQALQQITGLTYQHLDPLQHHLPLLTPDPNDVTAWIIAAEKYNWDLLAARFAAASAKTNIQQNFAGHLPTVDAIGSYQRGTGYAQASSSQAQSQIGLQLNVPIFAGGTVNSLTRQAQAQYVAANDQVELMHRQVVSSVRQDFNNVIAGISKIKADRVAVISAQSALASTEAGYAAGTKTVLDTLTAEQNLYQARSALAVDQYAYLTSTFQLKQAAGTLKSADITALNHWLQNAYH